MFHPAEKGEISFRLKKIEKPQKTGFYSRIGARCEIISRALRTILWGLEGVEMGGDK